MTFGIAVVVFFLIFSAFHASTVRGAGDELVFIRDLEYIRAHGWADAIARGIALTFMLLVYPFYYFLPDYVAIRSVNVLLFAALLLYFRFAGAIRNRMFYAYFLFFSSCGWFLIATNDTLFVVLMVMFLHESYLLIRGLKRNTAVLWSCFIVLFFTRELVYVYLPVMVATLVVLYRRRYNIFSQLWVPAILLIALLLANLPSITARGVLSYDQKPTPAGVKATWAQRQYLAQLYVNEGKLANYKHPSWKETDAYLQANGAGSLPKTVTGGIVHDIKLTVKEFFKDFFYSIRDAIRQAGIPLHITLVFLLYSLFRGNGKMADLYIPAVTLAMFALFSFIIISYVELRWLFAVIIMSLVGYSELEYERKIPPWVSCLNYLMYFAIMAYGLYRVIPKMHFG